MWENPAQIFTVGSNWLPDTLIQPAAIFRAPGSGNNWLTGVLAATERAAGLLAQRAQETSMRIQSKPQPLRTEYNSLASVSSAGVSLAKGLSPDASGMHDACSKGYNSLSSVSSARVSLKAGNKPLPSNNTAYHHDVDENSRDAHSGECNSPPWDSELWVPSWATGTPGQYDPSALPLMGSGHEKIRGSSDDP